MVTKSKKQKFLTLEEIQFEEKEMLRELINFFKKNKMEYYVFFGTLLGAVRHKGFIPWDDDIDLVMTRPEFNKFVEYLKKNDNKISNNLIVEGYELGNNNDFPILKVYNTNIKVGDTSEKVDKYLWIDIFPVDGVPKNNKRFTKRCQFLFKILLLKREQKNNVTLMAANRFKRIIKEIIMFILRIWPYDSYMKFYYKYCTKYDYDNSEYVTSNIMSESMTIYEKKKFIGCDLDFDDLKVKGFKYYDEFLTLEYGDYMQLPPEDKRRCHEFKAWKIDN